MFIKKTFIGVVILFGILFNFPCQANNLPVIQHWTTTKGLSVYFVSTPDVPILDILVGFHAGSSRDGNQFGLANLTNQLLLEGTQQHNADELAASFESLGAQVNHLTDLDNAAITLRSLTDPANLQPAINLLIETLSQPAFSNSELGRIRKQTLNTIQQQHESLDTLAEEAFFKTLYQSLPYAHPTIGTEESIPELTRQDVKAFYKRYYVLNNAVLVMVGGIDKTSAEKISQQVEAVLPSGEAAPLLPEAKPSHSQQVMVEHPSIQTRIRLGQLGITRQDPNYFSFIVGNYILGGGVLVSRLSDIIREKNGLSYFAYSYFMPLATPGPFVIDLETQQKQATTALQLTQQTVRDFIQQGPTDAELLAAQRNLSLSFPLRFDSNAAILQNVSIMALYNLPIDYFARYVEHVKSVTKDQIKNAFQQKIDPNNLIAILVGNKNS